jgi:hypothetical protein
MASTYIERLDLDEFCTFVVWHNGYLRMIGPKSPNLFDALARRESIMKTPTTEPKTGDAKPWWMSKTIAVQVGTVAVAVLSAVTDVVPKTWLPYILTAVAAINIGLRTITTKSLTLRGGRR